MPVFIAQLDSAFQSVSHPARALWRRWRLMTQLHEMGLHKKLCSISCVETILDSAFVRLWHLFASLPNSAESGLRQRGTSSSGALGGAA
jgi:hypothetical protein